MFITELLVFSIAINCITNKNAILGFVDIIYRLGQDGQ